MTKKLLSDYIRVYENTLSPQRCQALIDRFEASSIHHEIKRADSVYSFVQLDVNKAWPEVDLEIQHILSDCFHQYQKSLNIGMFWPSTTLLENLRLKRYLPGGRDGFVPHVDVMDQSNSYRFATAILYLNVPGGGETVFPDLDIAISPEPGRLVVFPPLWTFVHAGMPPLDRPKYTLQAYLWYPPPSDVPGS